MPALPFLAVGLVLIWLGRAGVRRCAELVRPSLDRPVREQRERSLRRGAWTCSAVGVLFVGFSVEGALIALFDGGVRAGDNIEYRLENR